MRAAPTGFGVIHDLYEVSSARKTLLQGSAVVARWSVWELAGVLERTDAAGKSETRGVYPGEGS